MDAKDLDAKDLRHTARHEAAHAVACILTRQPFAKVSIVPDRESFGRVQYDRAPRIKVVARLTVRKRRAIAAMLFVSVAGRAFHSEKTVGDSSDIRQARELCRIFSGAIKPRTFFDRAYRMAREWFKLPENRAAVEALADELMLRRELSAEEARAIVLRTGCGQERSDLCWVLLLAMWCFGR